MIENTRRTAFFTRALFILLFAISALALLYVAREIVIPLVFSTILAILISPVMAFLVRRRMNRVVAITIVLCLSLALLVAFGALVGWQLKRFGDSWPLLVKNFAGVVDHGIVWVAGFLDIHPQRIHEWIDKSEAELLEKNSAFIGQTLFSIGNALLVAFLIPIYVFMILFYQPLLMDFIRKVFGKRHRKKVAVIAVQIKTVIQRYLNGLLIEAVIVGVLNTAALLILGIEYAILLGILGAVLNVIPYIGVIVAAALPMMVALATKSPWFAVYILIIYVVIQIIDNNVIVPVIVASKVKINALFSVVVVVVGSAFWGLPGMFLSIPLLAIVKLICDHIDPLKPWGFLLGDTMPPILKIKPILHTIKIRIQAQIKAIHK